METGSIKMTSIKYTVLVAALLVLNCHWSQCQYYGSGFAGGYPGYPPIITTDNDDGFGDILPLLFIALLGRGGGGCGFNGGYSGGCGGGGCGGCGCGGCGGCGCGGCGCGCGCCCC